MEKLTYLEGSSDDNSSERSNFEDSFDTTIDVDDPEYYFTHSLTENFGVSISFSPSLTFLDLDLDLGNDRTNSFGIDHVDDDDDDEEEENWDLY